MVKKVLDNLPTGAEAYDYAYEEAMKRIAGCDEDSEKLAKQVLSWLTCAKRPLTALELQCALAVEVGERALDEDNLPEIEDMVSVCAGLVTIDDESGNIRLIHYTTQEYFERTKMLWFPKAESDTTAICMTYLSFDVFESGICQTDEEFEQRLQLNQLYNYAAQSWGHHARMSLTEYQGAITFLQRQAQIEASSQALFIDSRLTRYSNYSQEFPKGMTGLHLAAYFGVQKAVNTLVEKGADIDAKDKHGRAPLLRAVARGEEAVIKLLLENGAEIDGKDYHGRTPLLWAAGRDKEAVVKLLLEKGADIDSKDNQGRMPLLWAAAGGHEAIIKLLLEKGADIDMKNTEWGQTPLSLAAEEGYEAVVKLLLERGAEIGSRDKKS